MSSCLAPSLGIISALCFCMYQRVVAASTDVGTDLDEVEQLQKDFADFKTDLHANKSRVEELKQSAEKMIADGHSGKADIEGISKVHFR